VSKSGEKISGVGSYCFGYANSTKWDLEIGGLASIDADLKYISNQKQTGIND
jgi:hypothetical protein